MADSPFISQVGANAITLLSDPIYVDSTVITATGGIVIPGYCHVLGVRVLAPGSAGNLTIYNTTDTGDPVNLRFNAAFGSLTADQWIQLGPTGAKYMDTLYISSLPTSGVVLVHALPR